MLTDDSFGTCNTDARTRVELILTVPIPALGDTDPSTTLTLVICPLFIIWGNNWAQPFVWSEALES